MRSGLCARGLVAKVSLGGSEASNTCLNSLRGSGGIHCMLRSLGWGNSQYMTGLL